MTGCGDGPIRDDDGPDQDIDPDLTDGEGATLGDDRDELDEALAAHANPYIDRMLVGIPEADQRVVREALEDPSSAAVSMVLSLANKKDFPLDHNWEVDFCIHVLTETQTQHNAMLVLSRLEQLGTQAARAISLLHDMFENPPTFDVIHPALRDGFRIKDVAIAIAAIEGEAAIDFFMTHASSRSIVLNADSITAAYKGIGKVLDGDCSEAKVLEIIDQICDDVEGASRLAITAVESAVAPKIERIARNAAAALIREKAFCSSKQPRILETLRGMLPEDKELVTFQRGHTWTSTLLYFAQRLPESEALKVFDLLLGNKTFDTEAKKLASHTIIQLPNFWQRALAVAQNWQFYKSRPLEAVRDIFGFEEQRKPPPRRS
ncbi:MAG: hypothetical protein H6619_05135 [Deltaproteobacteria bacterium]|nr:hypothetical protein [Deltaproteobacteria bacterium]